MPRIVRLSDKRDFAKVFEQGRRSNDPCFTFLGVDNGLDYGRLGLAISKKAARRATSRNRLKRLAREAFRHHHAALVGLDVVVMARPGADRMDRVMLRAALDKHCEELPGRCRQSSKR